METYICFITLSTGSKHKITRETYNQILEAEKDDFIVLPNGTTFKNSAVMEIQDISEWTEPLKAFDYHQPYTALDQATGTIWDRTGKKGREAMLRGFQKYLDQNPTSIKAIAFFKQLKMGNASFGQAYEPKYNHVYDKQGKIIKHAWEVMAEEGVKI